MNISYSRGLKAFAYKPTEAQTAQLKFKGVTQPINHLIKEIEKGYSFLGGTYNEDHRASQDFISQQIFGVDIDGTLTLAEAEAILSNYDLTYNFGYFTFSHTEQSPRFRLLFVMDGEVHSAELVRLINKAFYKLFDKKTDQSCTDAARIWYGTNKKVFQGDLFQTIDLIKFLDTVNLKIYAKDRNRGRYCLPTQDIEIFHNSTITSNPIYNYRICDNCTVFPPDIPLDKPKPIRGWDLEDLFQCELFRRFYNGEASGTKPDKLSHMELVGLATNLAPLEGGAKLFKELLKKNKHYSRDKYSIISYVVDREYKAKHIKDFSHFASDKTLPLQTFPALVRKRGKVIEHHKPDLLTLAEVEGFMVEAFDQAFDAKDNKVYLIRIVPGVGKTRMVINRPGVVLALPTHKLKDQCFGDSSLGEGEKIKTLDLLPLFSPAVQQVFQAKYAMDLSKNVMMDVKALAAGTMTPSLHTPEDIAAAQYFLQQQGLVEGVDTTKTVFTTHQRALHQYWLHDTIVIDENPLNTIFESHSASLQELSCLEFHLAQRGVDTTALKDLLNQGKVAFPVETPVYFYDKDLIYQICVEQQFKTHVYRFFDSNYYTVGEGQVTYTIDNSHRFLPDKKYIICDGTAPVELYRQLFGEDRLVVKDYTHVEFKGKLVQDTRRSYSRSGMAGYEDPIADIDISKPTISFKDGSRIPNTHGEIYFGNCRGYNTLCGVNFNVVGTPHLQPVYYYSLAKCLSLNVTSFDMEYQTVHHNGLEFQFMAFNDPTLQKIQLQMVEGELVQAVQRSRLIRHESCVTLYSNFPLHQSEIKQ